MSKKVGVEDIKAQGLRGSIPEELASEVDHFSEAGKQILKFHGVYEQHDREKRGEKDYSCMIRTKIPGGQLTAAQYLVHDDLASKYANGTLRITTRQCFQFHGVLKGNLRETLRELNAAFVTTLGACGDIVRNVMACPAPSSDPQRIAVQDFAHDLTRALFPRTRAYHQVWIDGEEMINDEVVEDPLYGKAFLPRKFKIAITFPGDNCVDIYTNDVGLVALFDEADHLLGFNMVVGGGMGLTHNNDETIARLADLIGFVEPDQVVETVKAIVGIHRDFGDRINRKHARLKYILHDRGVEWFREELQSRLTFPLEAPRDMPAFKVDDHMGWHDQGDGRWYLGLPVENGRVADRGEEQLRSGLRAIIEKYQPDVRLTAQQSILLTNIAPENKNAINALLAQYGIRTIEAFSAVRRYGLACPALPTCGLAITEAERALPGIITELEDVLNDLGLGNETISVRMTGCPNGCARPYVAEIAFVGRSLEKYTIFLGGNLEGTRLAKPFLDLVHVRDLVPTLRPILSYYYDWRKRGEPFGDFVQRIGFNQLRLLTERRVAEFGD